MNYKDKIYSLIKKNKNIFLIGKSNSGKTYFVLKELIPFLESNNLETSYFSDSDKIITPPKKGVAIIDEVETFQDEKFLEKNNNIKKPYYTKRYIKKVNRWFKKLKKVKIPSIYIITRNNENEIKHFQKTVKTADWDNRGVEIVIFSKRITKN